MPWTNLSFAYGSILTSAKMTQLYDNGVAISPRFAASRFGTVYGYQEILATNSAFAPSSGTHSLIGCCVGGGGSGGNNGGTGGSAGGVEWFFVESVSGTYVAIVGSAGIFAGGVGVAGGATSFSTVCSADGGLGGISGITSGSGFNGESSIGKGGTGAVGAGGSAAANSGAGGGGGGGGVLSDGGSGGSGRIMLWELT